MITCPACNSRLTEADNFCPHCGKNIHSFADAVAPPPTTTQIDTTNPKHEPVNRHHEVGVALAVLMGTILIGSMAYRVIKPAQDWTTITVGNGKFSVSFPAEPTDQSTKSATQYTSIDSHGDHYLAQFVTLEKPLNDDDAYQYLDSYVKTLAGGAHMNIVTNHHVVHQRNPGVEETLRDAESHLYLFAWLTFVGNTNVFLGVQSKDEKAAHYDQFIQSFSVL